MHIDNKIKWAYFQNNFVITSTNLFFVSQNKTVHVVSPKFNLLIPLRQHFIMFILQIWAMYDVLYILVCTEKNSFADKSRKPFSPIFHGIFNKYLQFWIVPSSSTDWISNWLQHNPKRFSSNFISLLVEINKEIKYRLLSSNISWNFQQKLKAWMFSFCTASNWLGHDSRRFSLNFYFFISEIKKRLNTDC